MPTEIESPADVSHADGPLLGPDFLRRLETLELVSRKVRAGRMKGDRLSKRKGRGSEFADFRPYAVGDDLRFLDWNLFGRLDKLFLRLFLEEEDLHVYLLLDTSRSMDFGLPTKFRFAKQLAAALGFIGLLNLDRVAIETIGDTKSERSPTYRGRPSLWRMINFLEKLSTADAGDFSSSLQSFAARITGSGIAIVLSDFLDKNGYQEGLKHLVARGLDIYAIQIFAPEELEPDLTGDLKLTDIEDADVAEVTISAPLLERYRATVESFRASLARYCRQRGAAYLFTTSRVPLERLVLSYLRSRGLLR